MAAELQQIIDRLTAKAQILTERYAIVLDQRDKALAANRELVKALRRAQADNEQLRLKNNYLAITKTATAGSHDLGATRALLSDLVREIDKCIADLKQ